MNAHDINSDKSAGHDVKPATVELDDGTTIDAAHHIVNDDAQLLHLYLAGRSDGIDATIPLDRVAAIARTDGGREVLGINVSESGQRLVTDGGRDTTDADTIDAKRGERLWLDGEPIPHIVINVVEHRPFEKRGPWNPRVEPETRIAIGGPEDKMDPGYVDPSCVERCSECGDWTDGTVCVCDARDGGDA